MKTKSSELRPENNWNLECPRCGNTDRFIEVMAEEAHIVNGRRNYIRLLVGVVDHYVCPDCCETIEVDENFFQVRPRSRKFFKNRPSATAKTRRK